MSWHQVLDSPNPWRCTECGEFTRTGWEWRETLTLTTHALCEACVEKAVRGEA